MAKFVQALRFTAGMAMVAGGVALVAPIASEIVDRSRASVPAVPAAAPMVQVDPSSPVVAGHAIPDPLAGPPAAAWPVAEPTAMPEPAVPPRAPYHAPPPPPPLPASLPGVVQGGPGLDATYRSTLRIPPPPLLDAHGPPPVAPGWRTREPDTRVPAASPTVGQVPAAYTVCDGDDLTSLAIRFYGHPGAAAAIVAANRDQLANPEVLPIGTRLRLPPPWTVSGGRPVGGPQVIEPGPAVDRPRSREVGRSPFAPASTSQPWLSPPLQGS